MIRKIFDILKSAILIRREKIIYTKKVKEISKEYDILTNGGDIRKHYVSICPYMFYWTALDFPCRDWNSVKQNVYSYPIANTDKFIDMEIISCSENGHDIGSEDITLKALGVKGEKRYTEMTFDEFKESSLSTFYLSNNKKQWVNEYTNIVCGCSVWDCHGKCSPQHKGEW